MKKKIYRAIIMALVLGTLTATCTACTNGHAPGYGNTSKCTICGKTATHKTSNYGYCDKHWADATQSK